MQHLWAPWRMAYVGVPQPEGCVFCRAPQGEELRRELVLHRGEHCFLIMNMFPYNNGHLMSVPYRHTADFPGLTAEEQGELLKLAQYGVRALTEAFRPDGFNLGMNLGRCAGAGIADHLHLHAVPRWNGDTNFMPVLGETRVLPDALFSSYDRIRAAMERLGPPE
ncbi:MAG: HIT domain-containing protein [Armatimonadetes bacterium]|nr:HIT domain-containing protein [Armatimonadota bacterium]